MTAPPSLNRLVEHFENLVDCKKYVV